MPGSVTITPRLIYKEDMDKSTSPNETATATVAGLGSVTLHKVDAIFLSDLTPAANDSAAATAGIPVGAIYYNVTDGRVHARIS
jgi:hypothetical protein